jgi:hypothetical protein
MTTILELARKMVRGEEPPPPIGRLLGFQLKVIEPMRRPSTVCSETQAWRRR